jgi:hypothetical protein
MLTLRIAVWAITLLLLARSAEAGDKMRIEVVETSSVSTAIGIPTAFFAKVILPDGSHATLLCLPSDGHCASIGPISPEKISPDGTNCDKFVPSQWTCVTKNLGRYEAERNGNKLTIRAPNGKLKFKIVGSW